MSTSRSQNPEAKLAIDYQAEELLFYKKMHMRNALANRVKDRVAKITATRPDSAYAEQLAAREVVQLQQHGQKPAKDTVSDMSKTNATLQISNYQSQRPSKRASPRQTTYDHCNVQRSAKRMSPERVIPVSPEPPIPTATYVPWAQQVPSAHSRIPQTIVAEWHRLSSLPLGAMPNTPPCMCTRCPFSSGPPLQRRYHLLVAIINLENYLIGNNNM